jgi:hypothetical protein
MIFGVSAVLIITILIIVDIAMLLFRFWYVERKREAFRLECQAEMREHEVGASSAMKGIMSGRQEVVDSIRRMGELTEQLKNIDAEPRA